MSRGWRNRVLGWLLGWTSVTLVLLWLPLVRAVFDGASYQWGLGPGLEGAGVNRAYPLLVLGWAVGVAALWTGWRGPALAARVLLPLWHLPFAVAGLWLAVGSSEGLVVRGDTLGFSLDLSWGAAVVLVLPLLAAVWWALRSDQNRHGRYRSGWSRWNRRFALAALAVVPAQALLLGAGEPHGATDQAGVLLTIVQWSLLVAAIKPPAASSATTDGATTHTATTSGHGSSEGRLPSRGVDPSPAGSHARGQRDEPVA